MGTSLVLAKPYRWTIRANSSAGTVWGSWLNFSLAAPLAPAPIAPWNAISTSTPTYSWQVSSAATGYYFEVQDSAAAIVDSGTYTSAAVCSGATCAVTTGRSLSIGSYSWRVQARSSIGGSFSNWVPFSVQGPGTPVLISPSTNQLDPRVTFKWNAVAGAVDYQLFVDDFDPTTPNPAFQDNFLPGVCSSGVCSVTPGLFGVKPYTWLVRARSATGYGAWSSAMNFSVVGPAVPTQVSPNSDIATATPTYIWRRVDGATSYGLSVTDEAGTTNVLQANYPASVCVGDTCSVTPDTRLGMQRYTWYVRGQHEGGPGGWSGGLPFNVINPIWQGIVCGGTFTVADFDGDGRTDQLCAEHGATYVALSSATGFAEGTAWIVGDLPAHTTFADVTDAAGTGDPDGKTDIVIETGGSFYVSRSTGSKFEAFVPWGASSAPWNGSPFTCSGAAASIGIGDFDGDGRPDAFCRTDWDGRFLVGLNTGTAFQSSVFGDNACDLNHVGTLDFDGDGRTDWFCTGRYALTVQLSNGTAFEQGTFSGLTNSDCEMTQLQLGDFNADGRPDAFCAGNGNVLLNTGRSFLLQGAHYPFCTGGTNAFVADLDGDSVPEIVCNREGAPQLDIQTRRWTGNTLLPEQRIAGNWCSGTVIPGDFDGDTRSDLMCMGWWEDVVPPEGQPVTQQILHGTKFAAYGTSGVVPDLMLEAANGIGGTTTASYGSTASMPGATAPPAKTVLTSVTLDDGRNGRATTSFQYLGGKNHPSEGFLGYGYVKTTRPCLTGESACPYSELWLSQELPSLGQPTATAERDGSGKALRAVAYTYANTLNPVRKALLARVDNTDYGSDGSRSKTVATTYDEYDAYGNVKKQTAQGDVATAGDELETLSTYNYDTSNYLVGRATSRDQRGSDGAVLKRVTYAYVGANLTQVTTRVLPQGKDLVKTITYYAGTDNPYRITDEIGGITQITYEADGLHPATVTDPAGNASTTSWHTLCGVPTDVVDANSQHTTTTYDELCRPRHTTGQLSTFQDTSYIDLGDPSAQHTRVEGPGTGGNDWAEQYFDGLGRVYQTRKRGPSSSQTIFTEQTFDARGNLASQTAPFYDQDDPDVTGYSYDPFDRVTRVDPPDHNATTKAYDLWSVTTTDANGKAVTEGWTDARTKLETRSIDGEEVVTRHNFDPLGRLKTLSDARDNQWTWQYDSLDRIYPHQTDPDAGMRSFTYDESSRTNTQTDAKGQTLTVRYDAAGRTTSKASTAGTTTYAYGEARSGYYNAGRLTTVSTPAVGTAPVVKLQIDYDAAGRVKCQRRTIGTTVYTVTKTYDSAGRVTNLAFAPGGDSFGVIAYDEAGRPNSVSGILNSVTYDAAGRPLVQTNANGTATTRTYWPQRGLLHTLVTTGPAQTIQSLSYDDYDPVGLLRQVTGIAPGQSWQYGYDDGYRLNSATTGTDSQTFTYDTLGRIRSNSKVGVYEYPTDGPSSVRPHAPTLVNGAAYQYNENGNLTSGGGRSPQWDAEDRITAIGSTTFAYDDAGERVKKTTGTTTSYYPFGDDWEITGSVTTKYLNIDGLGVIAKRVTGGSTPGLYWIHTDRLGSIVAETSANGSPRLDRTYRPYGETLTSSGTQTESRGWIDQRNDGETGLTYLHARYYDPRLGIFLSPDPIGPAGGTNLYGYGDGDPVNYTDRSGFDSKPASFPAEVRQDHPCVPLPGPGCPGYTNPTYPNPNLFTSIDEYIRQSKEDAKRAQQQRTREATGNTGNTGDTGDTGTNNGGDDNGDGTGEAAGGVKTTTCRVVARVLKGNKKTVGKQGGIPGTLVAPNTAAVIPSQFGARSGNGLRPYAPYIRGSVPVPYRDAGRVLFNGVSDTIGGSLPREWVGKGYPNVRAALMAENPGMMIIERVTGEADMGVMMLDVEVPEGLVCSVGN